MIIKKLSNKTSLKGILDYKCERKGIHMFYEKHRIFMSKTGIPISPGIGNLKKIIANTLRSLKTKLK